MTNRVPWYGPPWLDANLFLLRELESYTLANCPINYTSVWIRMLIFSHFLSLYVTVGYYIIAPTRRELYILFVGLGTLFDELLNWGLLYVFMEPGPYAFVGCNPNEYNTPDPSVEQYTFVFVSIVGYSAIHGISLGLYERMAMTLMLTMLALSQVRLGYSSMRQIALASIIGSAEGALFQLIGFYVFAKHAKFLSSLWIVRFFGYKDTMIFLDTGATVVGDNTIESGAEDLLAINSSLLDIIK